MKKILLSVFLFLAIAGLAAPSWAFGSRHHGTGRGGDDDQVNFFDNGSNPGDNGDGGHDGDDHDKGDNGDKGNNGGDNGDNSDHDCRGRDCDERAPVPEPMTVALLAVGLIGIAIVRRKRA